MSGTIGIDISAAWFDVALDETHQTHRFAQSAPGIRAAQQWLAQVVGPGPWRIGIEATGVYSDPVARALHAAGHTVIICNPLLVHRYAQALGQRTKTDRRDAALIAQYCARHPELHPWAPPTPEQHRLRTLVHARQVLRDQVQQLKNQVASAALIPSADEVTALLAPVQDVLEGQLRLLDAEIAACAQAAGDLGAALRLLTSIPGIGLLTAATLLAYVPFERFDRPEQAVAFVGLCQREEWSGRSVHRRHGVGGMGPAVVRHALFLPAATAAKHNPVLRAFAERLRERHKPGKVVIVAVMRKLVELAWTLLHKHQSFSLERAGCSPA